METINSKIAEALKTDTTARRALRAARACEESFLAGSIHPDGSSDPASIDAAASRFCRRQVAMRRDYVAGAVGEDPVVSFVSICRATTQAYGVAPEGAFAAIKDGWRSYMMGEAYALNIYEEDRARGWAAAAAAPLSLRQVGGAYQAYPPPAMRAEDLEAALGPLESLSLKRMADGRICRA